MHIVDVRQLFELEESKPKAMLAFFFIYLAIHNVTFLTRWQPFKIDAC